MIPKFQEHSAEELRSRAAILAAEEAQRAARAAQPPQQLPPQEAASSSAEDTDDEAFLALHKAMEEGERARYAGWTGESPFSLNLSPFSDLRYMY